MIENELTQELWEQLTPKQIAERFCLTEREVNVLRKRFGIGKPADEPAVPPHEDEDNGSGGVPALAKPPN